MRICFIGDSFVNGTGDDACLGWTGRICAAARRESSDITLYNLGVRGDTSLQIAARWEREARARLPRDADGRLVFSFGVNDCVAAGEGAPRVALSQSVAAARGILSAAKAWCPTLMIGPPPTADDDLNARVSTLAAAYESLCRTLMIPFFSPWDALISGGVWQAEAKAGDGAHPNERGYRQLAELISVWPPWRAWVE